MQLFNKETKIDFLGKRTIALTMSAVLLTIGIGALIVRGLNFGIDFTGGTLVEVGYDESVQIESIRETLSQAGFEDAVVQYFGTTHDIMIRLPGSADGQAAKTSSQVMKALRKAGEEVLHEGQGSIASLQQCSTATGIADCKVQMRRVEFVGPQVGDELTNQGGLAMLYALLGILIYVTLRFKLHFAVGSVVALVHDVLFTLGAFALFQFEFSLSVLAAVLAVIGYSLNDTIVVFDRIRENFRRMRKSDPITVMNVSINQTLPRTLLTSLTTLLVVLILLIFGGEVIRYFSTALLIGVLDGTYPSIVVARPVVKLLGIPREDMMPLQKEGEEIDANP